MAPLLPGTAPPSAPAFPRVQRLSPVHIYAKPMQQFQRKVAAARRDVHRNAIGRIRAVFQQQLRQLKVRTWLAF